MPLPGSPDFVDDINNMCRAFVDRVFAVEDMIGPFDSSTPTTGWPPTP